MMTHQETLLKLTSKLTSKKRISHSIEVAKMTQEIIRLHNLDVNLDKAYLAGLLHDYAKEEEMSRYSQIVQKYYLDEQILQEPFSILHALLGPYIIYDDLGFNDEEIFSAIKVHPIGHPKMDLLSEVLFLADFISLDRSYEICVKTREVMKLDYKKAIAMKLAHLITYLEKPHKLTIEAFEMYKQYL